MNKLYKLEDVIRPILEKDSKAREDDMYLYKEYLDLKTNGLSDVLLPVIFEEKEYRTKNKIASYDSVGRCRRKLQEKNEYLKPKKEVQDQRDIQQMEFFEYATDYSSNFMKFVDSQQ